MNTDRFKFRVWVDEAKRYCANFSIDTDGVVWSGHGTFRDGIVIEQCTGMEDKKGRLIYEGDVVLLDTGREKLVHTVKWFQGKFVLINEKGDVDGLVWSGDNRSVIGNIHEREANK